MSFQVEFTELSARQTIGLPEDAYLALIRGLGKLLEDPWDSDPTDEYPTIRRITFATLGLATVRIEDRAQIVRVLDVLWIG